MGEQTQTAFGAWLKRQREGMGLSPEDLARRLDTEAPAVASLEAGTLRPSRRVALGRAASQSGGPAAALAEEN